MKSLTIKQEIIEGTIVIITSIIVSFIIQYLLNRFTPNSFLLVKSQEIGHRHIKFQTLFIIFLGVMGTSRNLLYYFDMVDFDFIRSNINFLILQVVLIFWALLLKI